MMATAGAALDRSLKLVPPKGDAAEQGRSVVGDLMAGLARDYAARHGGPPPEPDEGRSRRPPTVSSSLSLSPKQIDSIMEARAFQNIWEGSVRSGKTIASLLRWLDFVANRPEGGELVMVGRTRDSLARNVFGPLTDPTIFGPLARDITYTNGAPTARRPAPGPLA